MSHKVAPGQAFLANLSFGAPTHERSNLFRLLIPVSVRPAKVSAVPLTRSDNCVGKGGRRRCSPGGLGFDPLTPAKIARLTQQFEHYKAQLLQLSWITQGSIF